MNNPIKIIIVDDHPLFRLGLKALLKSQESRIVVVGEAASGKQLDELLAKNEVDVVLLDIIMPEESGIEIARRLKKTHPSLLLLMLSAECGRDTIRQLMDIGINGFISKTAPEYELLTAIEYVADGGEYFGRDIARIMHCIIASKKDNDNDIFTPREKDIIKMCCDGKSAKEIAASLNISLKTVITHKYNIFQKLGIHSATELVGYSIKNGIVQL
jgi:DNA-binding NarL/FixJ family response regulator